MKMTLTMDDGEVREYEGNAIVFGIDLDDGAETGLAGEMELTMALACMVAKSMANRLAEHSEIAREAYVATLFQMMNGTVGVFNADELKATNEEA